MAAIDDDPTLKAIALSHLIQQQFQLKVHPRSIEKALSRKKKRQGKMNPSPVELVKTTAIINAYEALRASVLISQCYPLTHQSMQRLISEGLYAWIITLNGTCSNEPVRTSVDFSSDFTAPFNESGAIVELIASMTLQSLTEETYECVS